MQIQDQGRKEPSGREADT